MGCKPTKIFKDTEIKKPIQQVFTVETNNGTKKNAKSKNRHNKSGRKTRKKRSKHSPSNNNTIGTSKNLNSCCKLTHDSRITAKYDVKAVIGKGQYSKVYRVEHRITKQPYAFKIIEAVDGTSGFEAEIAVLRRVNHPNVVQLVELFEISDKIFMVMELATGGTLIDRLETQGHFSELESRSVIKMILSGIQYLHGLGITHRDLKLDNLLYYHPGKDSKILISDFGLASTRRPNGNNYMHTFCGTAQYIAPEIVARKPYTCAVDIWAIGVITYVLISGMFPFDSEHEFLIFKQILKCQYVMIGQIWESISNHAKDFIQALLCSDISQRPTAVQATQLPWITGTSDNSGATNLRNKETRPTRVPCRAPSNSSHSSRSDWSLKSLRTSLRKVRV